MSRAQHKEVIFSSHRSGKMLTRKSPLITQYFAEELIVGTGWDVIDAAELEYTTQWI